MRLRGVERLTRTLLLTLFSGSTVSRDLLELLGNPSVSRRYSDIVRQFHGTYPIGSTCNRIEACAC